MTRAFITSSFALFTLTSALPALAEPAAVDSGERLSAPASRPSEPARDSGAPLLFDGKLSLGGYGGVDALYTRMFGRDGMALGLQGAFLVNHRFALGLAGYAFSNPPAGPDDADGDAQRFETAYGGLTLRYSLISDRSPVYVTLGGLIGGGAIELTDYDDDDDVRNLRDGRNDDTFAVFQPDITLHANLTRWMRLGATAGYRFTAGVDGLSFEESDLNGIIAGGHVQFGSF